MQDVTAVIYFSIDWCLPLWVKFTLVKFCLKSEEKIPVNKVNNFKWKITAFCIVIKKFHNMYKPLLYLNMFKALTIRKVHFEY